MVTQQLPPGFHALTPHLCIKDCSSAIDWYKKVFAAREIFRNSLPDGSIIHARLEIGGSMIMLNDEFPDMGATGPSDTTRSPVTVHLYVDDVDALWERALAAGATPSFPLDDMFWGDRYGCIKDPFNHQWSLATVKEVLTPHEIMERSREHFASGACD